MSRPSKLNAETSAAIIKALSIGATYKDAAEAAGVHYDTFNEWMKAGEEARSGKFYEFSELVKRTEAATRNNYVAVLARAANEGDWRAALEYLKRRDRATWGDNLDMTSGGKSIVVDYKIFNLDELLRIKNGESETVVYADALQRLAASQSNR